METGLEKGMETGILIKDREAIIEIFYEDILKYHGGEMVGGVALAYRLFKWALPKLSDEPPKRGDVWFYSGLGENAKGIADTAEMVLRARTHGLLRLDVDYSADKPGPPAPGGGRYYFELGTEEKKLSIVLKDGLIPDEFWDCSRLAHHCKAAGRKMTREEKDNLTRVRRELAAALMSLDGNDLFQLVG